MRVKLPAALRKGCRNITLKAADCLSAQENVVHTSDSLENAEIELKRFFVESDYCDYKSPLDPFKYAPDEY